MIGSDWAGSTAPSDRGGTLKRRTPDTFAVITLAALVLSVGCAATIGRTYKVDAVGQLVPGKTTEDEAIEMLGAKPTHRQSHLTRRPDAANWKEGDYYLGWVFARGTAWAHLRDDPCFFSLTRIRS